MTGILSSRLLGPSGRGIYVAAASFALTVAFGAALGFSEAISYFQSQPGVRWEAVTKTALWAAVGLGALGLATSEALSDVLFRHQGFAVLHAVRIYLFIVPVLILSSFGTSILQARNMFTFANKLRIAQALLYMCLLATLSFAGVLTPALLLYSTGAVSFLLLLPIVYRLSFDVGKEKTDWRLLRRELGYGFRLCGSLFGALIVNQLDLTLLTAFVRARDLGFYAVAITVSGLTVSIIGSLSSVLLPALTSKFSRNEFEAASLFAQSWRLTLVAAILATGLLSATLTETLPLLYGATFRPAVVPTLMLMPGAVALCSMAVSSTALTAFGRPLAASASQAAGVVVTACGLGFFLSSNGIYAAAIVSSVAYGVSGIISLVYVKTTCKNLSWRRLISISALRDDLKIMRVRQ